jgi:hypothetical protein
MDARALPRRPLRLSIAAVLMALEGGIVLLISAAITLSWGSVGSENLNLHVLNTSYAISPPVWFLVFIPLAVLQLIGGFCAAGQRYFSIAFVAALASAIVGIGLGIFTGGWAWFITRAATAMMVGSSRRSFID